MQAQTLLEYRRRVRQQQQTTTNLTRLTNKRNQQDTRQLRVHKVRILDKAVDYYCA